MSVVAVVRTPARTLARPAAVVVAVGSMAISLAASMWLVLAAAERPSVLSPPTIRADAPWLLGPLHGLLPNLTSDPLQLRSDLTVALAVMFGAWLLAWVSAPALPVNAVAVVVGVAQLIFFLGPPQPLTDFFNYIVYGRMAANGVDPYTHIPLDSPHDAAYALSNWHHLSSPYGPLFTLITEPFAKLPLPVAYWSLKALIVGCALLSLALVWWLAKRLGRSPQRALACAGLCPVTLAVGLGGFHNDTLAMACLLGAVACMLRGSNVGAGGLVVAAAAIKPSLAVVLPLVVLGSEHRLVAAAAAVAAGLAMLALFAGVVPALRVQDRLVNPLSLPNVVGALTGHGGADATMRAAGRAVLIAAVAAASAATLARRRLALPAIGVVLLVAALSLSWIMPWYLAWALPFVAIGTPRALAPFAVAACLWLGIAGVPQLPKLVHAVGWYPTRSATGHANHELEVRLVQ